MNDNLKIRKIGRVVLAFFSTCFLVIMLWILVDCFTAKSTATDKVISYKVKDDISYNITLKDNQFFTSEEANEDNLYITSLLDTLQVNFNYELVGSKFFSSDYNYTVIITLTSMNDGKVIWNYEEQVLSQIDESVSDVMEVKINDTVNIDLSHLYNKANEFYNLTGYHVDLDVKVKISNDLKVNGYTDGVKDKQTLSLSIPITEKVVSIDKSSNNTIDKKIFHQYEVNEEFNTYLFIISFILIISLVPLTVRSYISLFNLINLDDYDRKLKRLKGRYDYLIKDVSNKPDFSNKEVLEVINCNELASICAEKDLMINVYEKTKGKECWFYVIDKRDVYIYYLSLDYKHIEMSNKGTVRLNRKNKRKSK